jgi:hypothetical protein
MFYADCTKSADRQVNAVKKLFSIIYCCLPDVFQEGNRSVSIGLGRYERHGVALAQEGRLVALRKG